MVSTPNVPCDHNRLVRAFSADAEAQLKRPDRRTRRPSSHTTTSSRKRDETVWAYFVFRWPRTPNGSWRVYRDRRPAIAAQTGLPMVALGESSRALPRGPAHSRWTDRSA